MAKKHVCMIVLIRPPMPVCRATVGRIDRVEADVLVDELLLHLARQPVPDLVGGYGAFSRKTAPSAACSSTSTRSRNSNWWHATNRAFEIR